MPSSFSSHDGALSSGAFPTGAFPSSTAGLARTGGEVLGNGSSITMGGGNSPSASRDGAGSATPSSHGHSLSIAHTTSGASQGSGTYVNSGQGTPSSHAPHVSISSGPSLRDSLTTGPTAIETSTSLQFSASVMSPTTPERIVSGSTSNFQYPSHSASSSNIQFNPVPGTLTPNHAALPLGLGSGPGGASQVLIASVVQRLVNRLPCNSGWRLSSLEDEELVRSSVANLVGLSRYQLAAVVTELLIVIESLNRPGQVNDDRFGTDVLQSQLFMLKVLVACMIHHWKSAAHENEQPADSGALQSSSAPSEASPLPKAWEDPPQMDDTLAKHVLSVMTLYLRQTVAREDITSGFGGSGNGDAQELRHAKNDGSGNFGSRNVPSDRSLRELERAHSGSITSNLKSHGTKSQMEAEAAAARDREADGNEVLSLSSLALASGLGLFVLYPTFPPTRSPFELPSKGSPEAFRLNNNPRFNENLMLISSKEDDSADSYPALIMSIYRHTSQVIFYLSASNWNVVYARVRNRLAYLSATAEETPNTAELRLLECSHLTRSRLVNVVQELCTSFLHLKRTAQQTIALVLRRAIWSWIQYNPSEFALLFTTSRRLEGGPDVLFDHVHNLAESTRKKLTFWPMMTSLLILCPDILSRAAIGEGRKGGSLAKKVNFLESMRKSMRNNKLSEMAALCCVDIFKAATYTPRTDSGLRLLVPDLESDLKSKLFDPQRPMLNANKQIEVSLMIELFVALFRLDPMKTIRDLVPTLTADSSPLAFRVVVVKGCVLLASERNRMPWNPDVSLLYPQISRLLRNTFKDLVYRLHFASENASTTRVDRRNLVRPTQSAKVVTTGVSEDASGRYELLQSILQLWCFDVSSASYDLEFGHAVTLESLAGPSNVGNHTVLMKAAMQVDSVLSLVYTLGHVCCLTQHNEVRHTALNVFRICLERKTTEPRMITFLTNTRQAISSCSSMQLKDFAQCLTEAEQPALQRQWLSVISRAQRRKIDVLYHGKVSTSETSEPAATQQTLPFAPNVLERRAEMAAIEVALLLTICSADTEVCSAAMQSCGAHATVRALVRFDSHDDMAEWNTFFADIADPNFVQTGRIAQQKRIRAILRDIQVPTAPSLVAWKEAYFRWSALTQVVARPLPDDSGEHAQDKAAQWHNFAGFLAAFGGCCAVEDASQLPEPLSATLLHPRFEDTEPPLPLVENFMQEMVDLLVSDSLWVREKVKETLGLDMSPRLNGILFRQVHAVLSDFFDKATGLPRPADMFTIFVEQSISVVQMVLNRMSDSEESSSVDIGSLMVLYVEYVNSLGKKEQALRIKTSLCQLCESLMQRKSHFTFTNELRVRNRLFQALVTWTSDSADEGFTSEKIDRLQRELDVVCLKTISILLDRLPLLLADDALLLDDKVEWAKSRQFSLYFNYFIKTLNRARVLEESEKAKGSDNKAALTVNKARDGTMRDLAPLRESAIKALSNLLASNIDSGLQHSLPLAYQNDPRIRTAFMQIMTNVLNQGTAFDDLERLSASHTQSKLVELICESDMQLALSICQVCRGYDTDSMDYVLLNIFDSRGGIIKFLKAALGEEVDRTPSEEMVFRSNSFRTHLLSVFGRTHGYEYLRSIIAPLITEMASKPRGWSFEIDPQKVDSSENVKVNQARLEEMAQAFIDQICASAHRVPAVLRELCRQIRTLMDARFPNSRYQGVGGFMFLRFISPAIVAPQIIDINLTGPGKELRRGLLLISKILQTLASNNMFPAHKELFMTSLNRFLKNNVWRIQNFLDQVSDARTDPERLQAADQPLGYGIHPYGYGIDEMDQEALHKFLFENIDKVGKDLLMRASPSTPTAGSTRNSTLSEQPSSSSLNATLAVPKAAGDPRRTYETLCSILSEIGEAKRKDTPSLNLGTGEVDGKQAFSEFIRRNGGRHIDEVYKSVFYEGPPSKAGRPVVYYVGRTLNAETIDYEGLILHCLQTLESFINRPFDIVLDVTSLGPEHLTPHQWLLYFSSMIPPEVLGNMRNLIIFNTNTTVKLYARPWFAQSNANPTPRQESINAMQSSLNIAYCNSIPELEVYIERRNMALDANTVAIMTAPCEIRFSQITMVWYYRALIPVSFRIGGDYLQITALKAQDIMPGRTVYVNDVFHLSEIDDVRAISIRGDDNTFFVTCRGGTISFLFNSRDRSEIVQSLRQAKARVSRTYSTRSVERTLLPSDVPGTLLNMAMLNIMSDDYDLRLSAYELLCALSTSFNFGASSARKRLLAVKGLALPANMISFVTDLSRDFAVAAPGVTLEFLLSFFEGFERATLGQKAMCLHYMAPWLSNLVMFTHTSREQHIEYQKRIKEILMQLINITTKQPDMYAIMQRGVWAQISKLDDLIPIFIEVFSEAAMDSGLHTPRFETVLDTMVSFASINLRGKLLSRLRRVIAKTAQTPTVAHLHENLAWKEIATLVRMNMMQSFTNRMEVLLYLPELLHIILLLAGNGVDATRYSIHGTAVNIMHSLCTEDPRELKREGEPQSIPPREPGRKEGLLKLRSLLNRFSDEEFTSLFGLPAGGGFSPFNASAEIVRETPDNAVIGKLASIMYEITEMAAPTTDTANSWRARLTSLITSTAFQYNPIIQSRAFVLLGCLAQGEIDDDLLYQILVSLRGSISEWASLGNDGPIISIVTCLSKVVSILPDRSRYLPQMFWLGVAMIQFGHVPLFKAGADLLHATVKTIWARNLPAEEGTSDLLAFLLNARNAFRDAACQLDDEMGVDFEINFSFAMAALLVKGIRHPSTKETTIELLQAMLRYSALDADGNKRSQDGRISTAQLGFFVALLPTATKPDEFGELLKMAGASSEACEASVAARKLGHNSVYHHLDTHETKVSLLVITLAASLLQHVESDAERLLLYGFLADSAREVPAIVSILYESLAPGMREVFVNSQVGPILDAVHAIAHIAVSEPVFAAQLLETSKRGGPMAYLEESGYASLLDCGAFTPLKDAKRLILAQLCTALLAGLIDAGTA